MWGFVFPVNLILHGQGDWNEWGLKCWCGPVISHMGTISWCAGSTVHPSLLCSGPLEADLWALYQMAPLPSGFWLDGPVGARAGDLWGKENERQSVPLVVFLQAGQSSVRCPFHADFSDFGSNSHTFLSPLLTYLQKWWYAYFITSAGLLQSSL